MTEWMAVQFMKLALSTALSGLVWVFVDGVMQKTVPFWVLWVGCVFIVFGVIFALERSDDHWTFF